MTALPLIRSSWEFFRKQPALLSVGAWFLFLPMLASNALTAVIDGDLIPQTMAVEGHIAIIILILLLNLLTIWGHCCVLVTGKRMLQTKAGRSRTSFRATASQAKPFIIPFILTNLLRGCMILLWAILLIVPGIVYAVRTVFAPVVVVGENVAYRAALQRSKDAVKGNGWRIFGDLVLLIAILFIIPMMVITVAALPLPMTSVWQAAVSVVSNAWIAVASILINLCLIQMYEKVRAPKQR
jgi:uncharacterized membrane protein